MLRWTLNILAGLSLTVLVATIILWVRSATHQDCLSCNWITITGPHGRQRTLILLSRDGQISIDGQRGLGVLNAGQQHWPATQPIYSFRPRWLEWVPDHSAWASSEPIGWSFRASSAVIPQGKTRVTEWLPVRAFNYESTGPIKLTTSRGTWTDWRFVLAVPHWFIILLAVILPAWRFGGWKWRERRRRQRAGLCPTCGYDIRATPEPNGPLLTRCPECGTTVPAISTNATPQSPDPS